MSEIQFSKEDNESVEWCETNHPELCTRVQKNHDEPIYYVL